MRGTCKMLILWGMLSACGPRLIPTGIEIDRHLTFEAVKAEPDAHKGKWMIVGGEIINIQNLKEMTEIEVLEQPLVSGRYPSKTRLSRGRFILVATSFLDPELFKPGRQITAAARVFGGRSKTIGEALLVVPLYEEPQIHLWPTESMPRYAHDHWPDVDIGVRYGHPHGW